MQRTSKVILAFDTAETEASSVTLQHLYNAEIFQQATLHCTARDSIPKSGL